MNKGFLLFSILFFSVQATAKDMEVGDNGHDPFTPGCTASFLGEGCSGEPTLYGSDSCGNDGVTLYETDNNPGVCGLGIVGPVNCNTLCSDHQGGVCVEADAVCAYYGYPVVDSAKCQCNDGQVPTDPNPGGQ